MKEVLFDAVLRVLLCGMAVLLLTALAAPELIELGVGKKFAETAAPWLAGLIVTTLYIILFAWPRRGRPVTLTEAERKEVEREVVRQAIITGITTLAVVVAVDSALHLVDAPAWLHSALAMAVAVMATVAAIEWQLLKRGRGGSGRR